MTERAIPMLMARTIQPVADFYTTLGFEIIYLQKAPYAYLVVRRGGVELQFYGMKDFEPAESMFACYIETDDVEGLYATFRAGLKAGYGTIPIRGIPRIGPLKDMSYGVRQFLLTDPGGNSIRVGQPTGEDPHHRTLPEETFAKALHMAVLFADSKEDLPAAVKTLDRALARTEEQPTPVQLVQLLVLRADLAQRLDNPAEAADLLARAQQVELTEAERELAADDLRRAAELAQD